MSGLSRALAEDGFVVVDLWGAAVTSTLHRVVDQMGVDDTVGFTATCNELRGRRIDQLHRSAVTEAWPHLGRMFPDHRVFIAGFVVRGRHAAEPVAYHQDLTYTDERRHRPVLVWCPLVDVAEGSGCLRVVPGSHRWTTGIRAAGLVRLPTDAHQDAFAARSLAIPLRAGQAVLYDPGLVHGSEPNAVGRARPALALGLAPDGAELVHFRWDPSSGSMAGWLVDDAFYLDHGVNGPTSGRPMVDAWAPGVEESEFLPHLERTPPAVRPSSVSRPTHRPPRISTRRCKGLLPLADRPALRDPALDLRLRRDGFVRFPLIDRVAAEELRTRYGQIHGWLGEGFEADLNNPDVEYRRRVSRLLKSSLEGIVLEQFAGFEPYLRVFLCKWPGPSSELYLHQDWMYVDERRGHRSYVVWIALQDVLGDEGQLQVLRHSHRLTPTLRGTGLESGWMRHEALIRDRLLTVPARAGEAIVMDNGLVHCSLPNHSTAPRVVAAIGVRPAGVPLVHFRREANGLVGEYPVDEDFFMTFTPRELHEGPPGVDPRRLEVFDPDDLTERQLQRRLAASPLAWTDRAGAWRAGLRRGRGNRPARAGTPGAVR